MGAVVARRLQAWGGGGWGGGVTGMQPGAGQPGTRWARVYGAGRAQSKNGERGRQGSERADGEEWPDDLGPDDEPARRVGGWRRSGGAVASGGQPGECAGPRGAEAAGPTGHAGRDRAGRGRGRGRDRAWRGRSVQLTFRHHRGAWRAAVTTGSRAARREWPARRERRASRGRSWGNRDDLHDRQGDRGERHVDRKSTRLNSSHLGISYA